MTNVLSVTEVCFSLREPIPRQINVFAKGTVPTSGWGPGQLIPKVYVTPPADGIQEFEFSAKAPTGMVLQVISPTQGSYEGEIDDWVVGLRVISRTNSTSVMLDEPGCTVAMIDAAEI